METNARRSGRRTRASMRGLVLAAALAVAIAGAVPAATQPADESPPKAFLRSHGERLQRGELISYCWGTRCVDGILRYPRAVEVAAGRVRVRIRYPQRPDQLDIRDSRVNRARTPGAPSEAVAFRLRPVRRDGRTTAWDAIFRLEGTRHHYLDVFGDWGGDAFWTFHARTVATG